MSDSQNGGFNFNVNTGADASIFAVNQLPDILGIVKAKLQQAATNPDIFTQVFGDKASTPELRSVIEEWRGGIFSQLPSIQVISAADMNGADGAYASSTQKMYLSDSLFQSGAAPVDSVFGAEGVLIEETFHWLDDRVGTDTNGDEGELAKGLLFGVNLSDLKFSRIKNEDDRGFITVSGQSVVAEFASNRTEILLGNRVDFNGDGKTDFLRQEKGAFANDTARMLETYLSNGDGTFRNTWVSQDGNRNMHGDLTNLFMGDFNGDGKTDFLRQEKGSFASDQWWMLETFISNGDGSFTSRSSMDDGAMNGNLTNLFIGDFNGDGKSDFLRQEKGAFANDTNRMLETYLSNGNGTFRKAWVSQDGNRNMHGDLTNLFMGDFNGDGKTDFLRQEKGSFASDQWWMLETFISNGDGSFTSRAHMHDGAMNGDLTKLFVGDFDGNGRTDFLRQERGAFASDTGRMLETYTSNSDGSFVKRWQSDDGAMHGDLTNLFTNNSTRSFTPPPSGYYRELSSLTDNDWDVETGDSKRFDGNLTNEESRDSVKQIYSDLTTAILGSSRSMNFGYIYDAAYRKAEGKSHSGIDIKASKGDSIKSATAGKILWTESKNSAKNGFFIAVEDTNGRVWIYGHLESLGTWKKGDSVKVGDQIGAVGSQLGNNAHFHLAVGTKVNGGSVVAGAEATVKAGTVSPLQAYWEWRNR